MAQVDYFLKIDGIEGESADAKHKGEIDVSSWSWSESQGSHAQILGGMTSGKVEAKGLQFTSHCSKASPKFMLACADGEHFKQAVLLCRKAGTDQQEFFKITMSDVLVSHYAVGGGSGGPLPVDNVTLTFAKMEVEYKEQSSKGTVGAPVKAGYDFKVNKKV
jgi:type VI secretion system secreted protein Hcp